MVSLEPIWNRARLDLVLSGEHGEPDVYLWEHSVRVAQSALRIAQLPGVAAQSPDHAAVVAAGLYHEAGWVVRYAQGEVQRLEILTRPPTDNHRDQAVHFMQERLRDLLSAESLERASIAVRTLNDREVPNLEGRIVTEADNLDEFGVIALWPAVRRGALEGKGVRAIIDTWKRRKEYQFWSARLNDSFHFPEVREIARARLERLERFMADLEEQQQGADIVENAVRERPVRGQA